MTLVDVFNSLLQRLGNGKQSGIIGFIEVQHWPDGALEYFLREKLIEATNPADVIECPGCPEACFKPVRTVTITGQSPNYFIPCDETDFMGNIRVPAEYLLQWRITDKLVAAWVALKLGLRNPTSTNSVGQGIVLGLMTFSKSVVQVSLILEDEPSVCIGQQSLPLSQIVNEVEDEILLDCDAIRRSAKQYKHSASGYHPNNSKNEARKLKTQERDNKIYKQYKKIKQKNTGKFDTDIAKEIAKHEIAQGIELSTVLRIINKFKNN